jgi:ATP-dependent Clp protease adaptor protein ClpS
MIGETMTTATKVEEKVVVSLQPPKLWKVVFLNDDQTPMELVIELLTGIFKHTESTAKDITLEIHETGSGIAGVYPYEIAEQKGIEATGIARSNGSPLRIQVEQE